MRTNIEIDAKLMMQAMKASGMATKRAAVEAGLALLVRSHAQEGIRKLFGKVKFYPDYDYKAMRISDKWERALEGGGTDPGRPTPRVNLASRATRKKAA